MLEYWNIGNRKTRLSLMNALSRGLEGEAVPNRTQQFARLAAVSPSKIIIPPFHYSIIPIDFL